MKNMSKNKNMVVIIMMVHGGYYHDGSSWLLS